MEADLKIQITWIIIILCLAISQSPAAEFAGGTGEPNDPYQIATAQQLISIGDDPNLLDKHYVLINDIDLDPNRPGCIVFDKAVIAPDTDGTDSGFQGMPFTGVFDGNDHKIINLVIRNNTADYLGLFGRIGSFSLIKNVGLENALVLGSNRSSYIGGLVGYVLRSTITDCYVCGCITGGDNLGGLVGTNFESTITNSYAIATITGGTYSWYLGGLVGSNKSNGKIESCYATVNVTSGKYSQYIGGLAGHNNYNGKVENCHATANVTSEDTSRHIGGLVGLNEELISSCYSTGIVSGGNKSWHIGGLVGKNDYSGSITDCYSTASVLGGNNSLYVGGLVGGNDCRIKRCYSTGSISGGDDSLGLGGLVGYNSGYVISSFWDVQVSGTQRDSGVGLTTAEMMDAEVYNLNGWAGDPNWVLDIGKDYPRLAWEGTAGQIIPEPAIDWFEGDGTRENPYIIATAEKLALIGTASVLWDKHFVLTSDLDLTGIDIPRIGTRSGIGVDFNGTFDGKGHTIHNLTIISSDVSKYNAGLFGSIGNEGLIQNLALEDISISGNYLYETGGLVGLNSGTISNCHTTGNISCEFAISLGGMVGYLYRGKIINCYSNVSINIGVGTAYIGGLVGENLAGTIARCYTAGNVSIREDSDRLGGLVGYNYGTIIHCNTNSYISSGERSSSIGDLVGDNSGFIISCYSNGTVHSGKGSGPLGGLAGSNRGKIYYCYADASVLCGANKGVLGGLVGENLGIITNCYSMSTVYCAEGGGSLGGLVADDSLGYVANSFWDIEASGLSESAGGTGLTTAQMQDIQRYMDAGWDMVDERENGTADIWRIPEGGGYPKLAVFSEDNHPHILAGSGTQEDPYKIATAEDLGAINHYSLSASYELVADIDLSGITWSTAPILVYDGNFNGNGFVISGLNIHGRRHLGLFGTLDAYASVTNLGIDDANVTSEDFGEEIGIMAAQNIGNITCCYANGSISTGNYVGYIGGLVAVNAGNITDCYTIGSITIGDYHDIIGGLVGHYLMGSIATCYAATSITDFNYNDFEVDVGGLLGVSWGGTNAIIDCYFLAPPDNDVPVNRYGSPLTNEQMKQQDSFVGWDFNDIWMICEGVDYPRLQFQEIQCGE